MSMISPKYEQLYRNVGDFTQVWAIIPECQRFHPSMSNYTGMSVIFPRQVSENHKQGLDGIQTNQMNWDHIISLSYIWRRFFGGVYVFQLLCRWFASFEQLVIGCFFLAGQSKTCNDLNKCRNTTLKTTFDGYKKMAISTGICSQKAVYFLFAPSVLHIVILRWELHPNRVR